MEETTHLCNSKCFFYHGAIGLTVTIIVTKIALTISVEVAKPLVVTISTHLFQAGTKPGQISILPVHDWEPTKRASDWLISHTWHSAVVDDLDLVHEDHINLC